MTPYDEEFRDACRAALMVGDKATEGIRRARMLIMANPATVEALFRINSESTSTLVAS